MVSAINFIWRRDTALRSRVVEFINQRDARTLGS